MKHEYKMTDEQLESILESCESVPCIMVGGYSTPTPQANANRAWALLGKELGFQPMTVEPVPEKGTHFFMADPTK